MMSLLTQRFRAALAGFTGKGLGEPFNRLINVSSSAPKLDHPFARSAWVSRAIKKVAGPIAAVPLFFTTDRRAGSPEFTDPVLAAFWQRPAVGLSYCDFIEATVGWLKLKGESFWILDDSYLVPFPEVQQSFAPLIVARPDRMRQIVAGTRLLGWQYTDGAGNRHTLQTEQVVQTKFWNPYDDFRGQSEYEAAQVAAESDYFAGTFQRNLMANNGDRGDIVIAEGNTPDDKQREQIVNQLRMRHEAQRRGDFKPIFLAGQIKVENPKILAPDANFVASRMGSAHEIFIALGVPASMAEVVASYSIGSASDRYILIQDTCMPLGGKICEGIEIVTGRLTGKTVVASLDWDDHPVMQQVRAERMKSADILWTKGMPLRDINDYLDLGMKEFPGWEVGYLPFNVAQVGSGLTDPAQDPATTDAYSEPTAEPTAERSSRLGKALQLLRNRPATTFQKARDPKEIAEWRMHQARRRDTVKAYQSRINRALFSARSEVLGKIERLGGSEARLQPAGVTKAAAADLLFNSQLFKGGLLASLRAVARAALQTAGEQLFEEIGKDDPFAYPPAAAIQFIRSRENVLSNTSDDIHNQVKAELEAGLNAGDTMKELAARVRTAFNEISRGRSMTIALTETGAAYGNARALAMSEAGVTQKKWLTSGNSNVRPAHAAANGQVVGIDEPFIVDGEELDHPSDPRGSPGNIINCHCVAVAVSYESGPAGEAPDPNA